MATYKHIYKDGCEVQVGSAIRDGSGNTITTTYATNSALTSVSTAVTNIQAKIPSAASSSNQLADKKFVNSSISTETSHYISNNGQPFTSVEQLRAYSGVVINNDYAFVTGQDEAGNTYYDRYKATVVDTTVTWAKEYRLNNSSFTAQQWESINSGATTTKIDQIVTRDTAQTISGAKSFSAGSTYFATSGGAEIDIMDANDLASSNSLLRLKSNNGCSINVLNMNASVPNPVVNIIKPSETYQLQFPSKNGTFATTSDVASKSTVSVSATGTSTDEVQYITIDGVEKKLAGSGDYLPLSGGTMTGSILSSSADNDLGSVTNKWGSLYLNNQLYLGDENTVLCNNGYASIGQLNDSTSPTKISQLHIGYDLNRPLFSHIDSTTSPTTFINESVALMSDIPSTTDFVKKDGSVAMTGSLLSSSTSNDLGGLDNQWRDVYLKDDGAIYFYPEATKTGDVYATHIEASSGLLLQNGRLVGGPRGDFDRISMFAINNADDRPKFSHIDASVSPEVAIEEDIAFLSDIPSAVTSVNGLSGGTISSAITVNGDIEKSYGEIKSFSVSHKGYTGGATWYFPVCTLPVDNAGNYASAIIDGRIGGWTAGDMAQFSALSWQRGDYTGQNGGIIGWINPANTSASALNTADLVLYYQSDKTAILYVKCYNYYTFDIKVSTYQSSVTKSWTGSYTTTPSGTLASNGTFSNNAKNLKNYNYNDLSNKPAIPRVNDSTISMGNRAFGYTSFTLNQSSAKTIYTGLNSTSLAEYYSTTAGTTMILSSDIREFTTLYFSIHNNVSNWSFGFYVDANDFYTNNATNNTRYVGSTDADWIAFYRSNSNGKQIYIAGQNNNSYDVLIYGME